MSTAVSARTAAQINRTRQIAYALAILLIFALLFPYTLYLDRLKQRSELGEATIGQIDAGSFMLKLALLGGARGIAANVLWTQALDLQKVHEWDRLEQKVNMITKLQPHFLSVWTYQSWNLAYNVAVEWDDPADKYEWIKRGIKFVQKGVANNTKSPDLHWDTAWYYYQKIGQSDEAVVLRKLFREDEDEEFRRDPVEWEDQHIRTPRNDNYAVSRGWFQLAIRRADEGNRRLAAGMEQGLKEIEFVDAPVQHKGRPGDLAFRTMPAHAQTRYAAALEKASVRGYEPSFGEFARNEWEKALEDWEVFGRYEFPAFSHPDQMVRLDDIFLPKEEFEKLTGPQQHWTNRWANDSNYRYWKDRARAEREKSAVEARQHFYLALKAQKTADFETAVAEYRVGLELWQDLLDRHPYFRGDEVAEKDTGRIIGRYVRSLRQLGETIDIDNPPANMPFRELVKPAIENPPSPDPFDDMEIRRSASSGPVAAPSP